MPPRKAASPERDRYARLARLAAETAVAVGDAIAVDDIGIVTRKHGRANFATAADHAAEKAIMARLRAHDPSIAILAEESATKGATKAERLWVVDPIDGTLNFSRGLPFYCVVIGYVEDGVVRAAAIHAPRTRETFAASQGAGATLNGMPIRVGSVRTVREAVTTTAISSRTAQRQDSRFAALNASVGLLRDFGSAALGCCYVANGRLDLFVHEFLSPWDIAGPQLVAREAGAAVISLATGEDANWDERQVIVGNPSLVREALAAMPLVRKPQEKRSRARG